MSENNKRKRYPRDAARLHELRARLEREIVERQEMLTEVRRLEAEAEKTEIFSMVKSYNVTPEEFARMVDLLRNNLPGPDVSPQEAEENPSDSFDLEGYEIVTEENEDE